MKYFEYLQPQSIKEASKLLGNDFQKSLLYAGGSDLIGLVKHGIVSPDQLVNLKSVSGLNKIEYTPGKGLALGALVNISDIADHDIILKKFTVLAEAALEIASPQLRNMGTLGGNLCQRPRCWYFRGDFDCLRKGGDMCYAVDGENKYHCIVGGSPCFIVHPSDSAVALLALDAEVTIASGKKTRKIPLKDFFVLPEENVMRENILKPDEILTEVFVPEPPAGTVSTYIKFKERASWDFAIVSVAAVVQKSGKNFSGGKVAFGGVAPKPWMEEQINRELKNGLQGSETSLTALSETAFVDASPLEDNGYKVRLARNLLKRALSNLTTA